MKTDTNTEVAINQARVSKYNQTLSRLETIKNLSTSLAVNGVKDHKGLKKVVKTRKFIKRLRVSTESRRKELNADMLREIRENNFAARYIINELKPSEKFLSNIEKEIANEKLAIKLEKKRLELERLQTRIDALSGFGVAVDIAAIKDLSDEEFNALVIKTKADFEERAREKELASQKLIDETNRLKEENLKLKQSVGAIDPVIETKLVIDEKPCNNTTPAPDIEAGKVPPTPAEITDTRTLIKNYALALRALPVPVIKDEQARLVLNAAKSHINTGINMLLKAVE